MNKLQNDLNKIRNYIIDLFKDENTGHDILHLENVFTICNSNTSS